MNLLLHCCCGPCSTVTVEHFRSSGDEVTGWFFNPNIHPADELRLREIWFEKAASAIRLPLLRSGPDLDFRRFLLELAAHPESERCRACYQFRLKATAKEAAARGFDTFSTTLLISPYQDISAIQEIGRAVAGRVGLVFRSADLRERFAESRERARELGLYQQNYCGCLFSSLERARGRSSRVVGKLLDSAA